MLDGCCMQIQYGEVTYDTTFEDYTMLTGNVVSLGMGAIICAVWSFIAPENYDFVSMREIRMTDTAEDGEMGFTKVCGTPRLQSQVPKACNAAVTSFQVPLYNTQVRLH